MTPRIGLWLDSLHLPLKDALQTAVSQGFRAVQLNAAGPELHPGRFDRSARRHLRKVLADLGLRLDALAAEFPGAGLADPHRAEQRLALVRSGVELARDLDASCLLVRLAGLAEESAAAVARAVLPTLAELADRSGVRIAILDGVSPPESAEEAVRAVNCPHLGLVLDAGQLDAALSLARRAPQLLMAVNLRDVRRGLGGVLEEVPVGTGEADFRQLLASLAAGDFRGCLALRCAAPVRVDDLRAGREYMERLLP